MIIKSIDVKLISVPLVTPFKTALRSVDKIENLIVIIKTDTQHIGYGEAAPVAAITGETKHSVYGAISLHIAPTLIGMNISDITNIMTKLHGCMLGNTSAKAAVDMALYDLYSKSMNLPLYKLLGATRSKIITDITVSLNDTATMIKDSIAYVEKGFTQLKIKVGKGDNLEDAKTIKEIRKAIGDDIILRVDANQGWSAKQSIKNILYMEDSGLNIDLVEQPVNANDISGMQLITKSVYTKILADESIFNAKQAVEVIRMRAADIINIKLMKSGGIYKALDICAIAKTYKVECMIGCMLETKMAVSAAAHLAAGQDIITRVDLDGPALCSVDPFEGGPVFDSENIYMQEDLGIGTSISLEKLSEFKL